MEYMGGGKWESMDVHHHGGFKSARPVPEKKAIKTVATVAAFAAVAYYGGSFLAGAANTGGAMGASGFMSQGAYNAGLAASGGSIGGLMSSPYLSAGSLALQGIGMVQQSRAASEMQDAEKARQAAAEKVQASQERQSQVEATRARMAALREQRILQGRLTAASGQGGMAFGGTSAVAGSTGALNTQVGTAIGNINVAQGFANEQGQANLAYGRATSSIYQASNEAQGWANIAALGKELRQGQTIGEAFNKASTIFSIKA